MNTNTRKFILWLTMWVMLSAIVMTSKSHIPGEFLVRALVMFVVFYYAYAREEK